MKSISYNSSSEYSKTNQLSENGIINTNSGFTGDRVSHNKNNPCGICKGYDSMQKGKGARCHGYDTENMTLCSREEFAGQLSANASGLYAHLKKGKCSCGVTHAQAISVTKKSHKTQNLIDPAKIWMNASNTQEDRALIAKYFQNRKIEIIKKAHGIEFKMNRYKGKTEILAPMKNAAGKIVQLYRIEVNSNTGEKINKKLLGNAEREDRAIIFGNISSSIILIFEGLEDALTYYLYAEDNNSLYLVTGSTSGFSRINSFIHGKKATLILDPDKNNQSLNCSVCLGNKVQRLLPTLEVGLDCNAAHKQERLIDWIKSLKSVECPKKHESKYTSETIQQLSLTLTDLGNAERFRNQWRGHACFCRKWNAWLFYDGQRWVKSLDAVRQLAIRTVRSIYSEARNCTDDATRKSLGKHALKSESTVCIKNMLSLAESLLCIEPDEFDRNIYLLNLQNGTLDLRTGMLQAFNSSDYITKLAPVTWDENAECPLWLRFQDRISNSNSEVIKFKQKWFGYCLTGDVSERVFYFAWGATGNNGKSTEMEVVRSILGDEYAKVIPTETLMAQKYDGGIPNDIAMLKGIRLAIASETEQGKKLAEAKIKKLTGNETITARFMRAEFFQFMPEFKIVLISNPKPEIGSDKAIWNRIRCVPYTVQIPTDEIDIHLAKKLTQEASGILRWAVQGCLLWQRERLGTANIIESETENYRSEMDVIGNFLSEFCTLGAEKKTNVKLLWDTFVKNTDSNLTMRAFGNRLQEQGFSKPVTGAGNRSFWHGIGINGEAS